MTSGRRAIGFQTDDDAVTYEKMKLKVLEELKKHFRPEFLNRLDEVIVFHELTLDEVKEIVDLMLVRVREQLKSQGLELALTEAAKSFLATKGYDPELGARPLRRSIQRLLEDRLAESMLLGQLTAGTTVVVDVDVEADELTFESLDTPTVPPVEELADSE